MGIIGHDSSEVVSRKDYLKNKRKSKLKKFKIIPIFLGLLIIGLSLYVFKEIKRYNEETQIAKEIIEQNALVNTEKVYYVGKSYTKETDTQLICYSALDKSRKEFKAGQNLKNIQIDGEYIYGTLEGILHRVNMTEDKKEKVSDIKVSGYYVVKNGVYIYTEDSKIKGLYFVDKESKKETKLINETIYQMAADDNNIYLLIQNGNVKSISKYDLSGKNKVILTDKVNASSMYISSKKIYFSNMSDGSKVYSISKSGDSLEKVSDKVIGSYKSKEKSFINNENILEIENKLYFIENSSQNIIVLDLRNNKEKILLEQKVANIKYMSDKEISFTKTGDIGIYIYGIETKLIEKLTSARTSEYICIKNTL